ncbi:MAG: tetratricopeptide repeat protein [Rhodocyclaceae bacterium]|nr:tetratricopeptide repeat protein [Rhodocyclaceae bacterium]
MNAAAATPQAILAALQSGDAAAAARQARERLADRPADGETWFLLGIAQRRLGDAVGAVQSYRHALATHDGHADVWFNLGNALQDTGDDAQALDAYAQAIARQADHVGAREQIARLAPAAGRPELALAAAAALAAAEPENLERQVAWMRSLREAGRWDEARRVFETSLPRGIDKSAVLIEGGLILEHFGDHQALVALYERLDGLMPDHAMVKFHLGLNRLRINRNTPALAALREAEALGLAEKALWVNLGTALARLDRVDEALAYLERAAPDYAADPSAHVFAFALRQKICDWRGHADLRRTLLEPAVAGASPDAYPALPFPFTSFPGPIDEGEQLAIARRFAAFVARGIVPYREHPDAGRGPRIRLGYLSADFHDHATAHLMLGMFKRHDRSRFEVYAYSYGPEDGSEYRRRIRAEAEHFVDLAALSDRDAAARIHADGIDVLVDLKGYTREARTGILAWRPAPAQVAWLGYPGSMGAPFIDYALVDARVVPAEAARHYSETLLHMPHCYQVNDDEQAIAAESPTRAEAGLPAKGFVFCSFCAHYKLDPAVFDAWAAILARVPGSVLWLIDGYPAARDNLRREIAARGISPRRLVFAPRVRKDLHLTRHRLADLFLDTFAYNAHTTMSDALWAGLPAITVPGRTFATRVGVSLLTAAGLPELVAPDPAAYVELAVALARDRKQLAGLRERLAATREVAPLFDTAGFVRDWEAHVEAIAPSPAAANRRAAQEAGLKAAIAELEAGRPEQALVCAEAVLEEGCARPDAWNVHAVALRRLSRLPAADFAYGRGLGLKPDYADMLGNRANLLREQDRLDEALVLYREAARLAPGSRNALSNLASALSAHAEPAAQLEVLLAAERLDPGNADNHWDKALALLMLGRLREGFAEYEWRHARRNPPPREYPRPPWKGEPLAGRRLFLHWEQGYGDVIQFLRFVPLAAALGGEVWLEVQPGLARFAAAQPGVAGAVEPGQPLPEFDCWASLLSVPLLLGIDEATLPAARPYLRPPPAAVEAWRERLARRGGKRRPRVGLVWAGNPNVKSDRLRSPRLAPLLPLLALKDVEWVLLQHGDGRRDLEGVTLPAGCRDLAAEIGDFADTAAIMAELDLVISSDTSTAHLAAALGCETWVLLSHASDWRWGLGETSPWYPGVRLFRQPAIADWAEPVRRIAAALGKRFGLKGSAGRAAAPSRAPEEPGAALLQEAFGLYQRNRKGLARRLARASLMENPARPDAWCLLGVVERHLGEHGAAERAYRRAIGLLPGYADAWYNLGNLLRTDKRLAEAREAYEKVIVLRPDHVQALSLLSDVHRELQDLEAAEAAARRALALQPAFAEAWGHLGNVLNDRECFAEAVACYEKALSLPEPPPETLYNKGVALQRSRHVEESVACYRAILAAKPREVPAHYNLATALLTLGSFAEGFREYEWRLAKPDLRPRPYAEPAWNGEPLNGRRLFLYWEQGYGDSIQFLRFVPMLRPLGARVILELQAGLRGVAAEMPGVEAVLEPGEALPAFDVQAPLISLPARLGLDSPATPMPYLSVPDEAARRWAARLGPASGRKRVGLVWAGNPNVKNDRVRSPRLGPLLPLLALPGIEWVVLQQGDGRRDLDDVPLPEGLRDLAAEARDFTDTAAIMLGLDLMISSDTSTAHLAAALGRPTWTLLHYAADWRWMAGPDTAWYPGMRLFRQPEPGDWETPVARMAEALAAFAGAPAGGAAALPLEAS